jgi:CDP-diacylglycerol---glycerol-3-phosphate 3-phosphatidyltransferase
MLTRILRFPFTVLVTPLCRLLVKLRVSANAISVAGAIGAVVSAFLTFPANHLEWGTWTVTFFVLFDLLDGTVARMTSQGGSKWGALLDSTLDRIGDAALLLALAIYANKYQPRLVNLIILCIIFGALISYIRARAEGLGIECKGGLAERTDRLIIALVTTGFAGLGLSYIFAIGIWVLLVASVITVLQRLVIVYRASKAMSING